MTRVTCPNKAIHYLQSELHEEVGLWSLESAVNHVPHFDSLGLFDQQWFSLRARDVLQGQLLRNKFVLCRQGQLGVNVLDRFPFLDIISGNFLVFVVSVIPGLDGVGLALEFFSNKLQPK